MSCVLHDHTGHMRFLVLPLAAAWLAGAAFAQTGGAFRVAQGQLTFDAEGLESPGHLGHSRRLHWPGGASGVTIGRGYDMKERDADEVIKDLTDAGLTRDVAKKYAAGAGLEEDDAESFVADNRSLLTEITPEQQKRLFEIVYARYVTMTRTALSLTVAQWNGLNPLLRDLLVDLRYRGDLVRSTRALLARALATNDARSALLLVQDRSAFARVPCDRFYRRLEYLRAGLASQSVQASGDTPVSKRIFYDENASRQPTYANSASQRIGAAAADLARDARFRPGANADPGAAYARALGRQVWGKERTELQGDVAQQYRELRSSPFVEKLWVPDLLSKEERGRLEEARALLSQYRDESRLAAVAAKRGDRGRVAQHNQALTELRRRLQAKTLCLRLALREAQARANAGDAIIAVDPTHGRVAWIVPGRGADTRLRPAATWGDIPVPHIAFAGDRADPYAWLDAAFTEADSLAHLALFVVHSTP